MIRKSGEEARGGFRRFLTKRHRLTEGWAIVFAVSLVEIALVFGGLYGSITYGWMAKEYLWSSWIPAAGWTWFWGGMIFMNATDPHRGEGDVI